jgi:hypothetical protein
MNEFYILMLCLCAAGIIDAIRAGKLSGFQKGVLVTSTVALICAYKNGLR